MKSKEMNVYDFCRKNSKMSTNDLFIWLGIEHEYGVADLGNCWLRIIGNGNLIEISDPKLDFDRWALSDGYLFDLNKKSERRAFINFYQEFYS